MTATELLNEYRKLEKAAMLTLGPPDAPFISYNPLELQERIRTMAWIEKVSSLESAK